MVKNILHDVHKFISKHVAKNNETKIKIVTMDEMRETICGCQFFHSQVRIVYAAMPANYSAVGYTHAHLPYSSCTRGHKIAQENRAVARETAAWEHMKFTGF